VTEAATGGRNNALNTAAAFILGQLIAGGELRADEAWCVLRGAASRHVGIRGFTEGEMVKTIRSGITAGMRSPRSLTRELSTIWDLVSQRR
jgi:hypothetical protein